MMATVVNMAGNGLDGIIAATTHLSLVDGERGELVIGGYRVDDLAEHATFEETTWLLWHGELPTRAALDGFRAALASRRAIPSGALALLRECAARKVDGMDALRIAAGALSLDSDEAEAIVARLPTIVAAYWRLQRGEQLIAPRSDLGHAANFLYMLTGETADPERVRGLETYLNTVVDHGLNASTFTARVITSTGSDLVSAIVGALGALKGPLHGGAPGPALDMVFEIGDASHAENVLRRKIESGEKLMGFGHRVYKVRDPRADVLAKAAERMFTRAGDMSLYTLARAVEADALRLLEEYKPGRRPADQRGVLYRSAAARPGLRCVALHADVCDQPRERVDRARLRAAARKPHHPSAIRICGTARSDVDVARRSPRAARDRGRQPRLSRLPLDLLHARRIAGERLRLPAALGVAWHSRPSSGACSPRLASDRASVRLIGIAELPHRIQLHELAVLAQVEPDSLLLRRDANRLQPVGQLEERERAEEAERTDDDERQQVVDERRRRVPTSDPHHAPGRRSAACRRSRRRRGTGTRPACRRASSSSSSARPCC